ncbi:extracellular catalytic domain type 2 short-chain-length polyhydroxyalkanoate depolymerase [Uliginosibacterium gangwonense]|uniref:extracellular catalytic domain type 2 short-chain-length polyhydroxyalkanoate depolymerase n=1 Tax=Uliginosibacterium gangwonense TaxID=392736 RepID=UPI0003728078|nr:hypothetical protein [Uliginosibacterium gangwonense]
MSNFRSSHIAAVYLAFGLAMPAVVLADNVQKLPSFNVDISQTSVSGLSSGAFMSVQLGFAHSSIIKGVGVVAGGPYYCAQDNVSKATQICTCTALLSSMCKNTPGATDINTLNAKVAQFSQSKAIDDPANVRQQRIYLYGGAKDVIVPPPVFDDLQKFYGNFADPANIQVAGSPDANHTMPTPGYGNECSKLGNPFISKCDSDTAGDILNWIYGSLQPAQTGTLKGRLLQFNQREFSPNMYMGGMDSTAWLYVPAPCDTGEKCKIHVVLHGCNQGQSYIPTNGSGENGGLYYGLQYVKDTGYNAWADTNNIIVLYPQAVVTATNPQGCWDWWGYADPNYATKSGGQIKAIRAMIDRIAAGNKSNSGKNKSTKTSSACKLDKALCPAS